MTIPKNIREKYGLMPFIEIELVPEEAGVLIKMTRDRGFYKKYFSDIEIFYE